MFGMLFIPMLTTDTVTTYKTFGLLQLGPLSCMPVPGVTRGAANNLIVVKLVQPQSTYLE